MMNLKERRKYTILDLYLDQKGLHDLSPFHKNSIIYDFMLSPIVGPKHSILGP
jgi:hypothetical protein